VPPAQPTAASRFASCGGGFLRITARFLRRNFNLFGGFTMSDVSEKQKKMTVNRSNTLLKPSGITNLISVEYIPAADGRIEYPIPADFYGKLGFVFYQAVWATGGLKQ
jgi:hypothetical protein